MLYLHAASFLKIKSPTPYVFRNSSELQYGINFAHGGTGIFNTLNEGPNMTVQIDWFERVIQQKIYTKTDLESSVALVSAAGNDYATFLQRKQGSMRVSGSANYFLLCITSVSRFADPILVFINLCQFSEFCITLLLNVYIYFSNCKCMFFTFLCVAGHTCFYCITYPANVYKSETHPRLGNK